jgi:hypothetical protein
MEYGLHIAPFRRSAFWSAEKSNQYKCIKVFVVQETEFECGVECVILLDRLLTGLALHM